MVLLFFSYHNDARYNKHQINLNLSYTLLCTFTIKFK